MQRRRARRGLTRNSRHFKVNIRSSMANWQQIKSLSGQRNRGQYGESAEHFICVQQPTPAPVSRDATLVIVRACVRACARESKESDRDPRVRAITREKPPKWQASEMSSAKSSKQILPCHQRHQPVTRSASVELLLLLGEAKKKRKHNASN